MLLSRIAAVYHCAIRQFPAERARTGLRPGIFADEAVVGKVGPLVDSGAHCSFNFDCESATYAVQVVHHLPVRVSASDSAEWYAQISKEN